MCRSEGSRRIAGCRIKLHAWLEHARAGDEACFNAYLGARFAEKAALRDRRDCRTSNPRSEPRWELAVFPRSALGYDASTSLAPLRNLAAWLALLVMLAARRALDEASGRRTEPTMALKKRPRRPPPRFRTIQVCPKDRLTLPPAGS
jgi:hypothetical protein